MIGAEQAKLVHKALSDCRQLQIDLEAARSAAREGLMPVLAKLAAADPRGDANAL